MRRSFHIFWSSPLNRVLSVLTLFAGALAVADGVMGDYLLVTCVGLVVIARQLDAAHPQRMRVLENPDD